MSFSLENKFAIKTPPPPWPGGVPTVPAPRFVADTTAMPHTYDIADAPGVNIHRLRVDAQLSQRALADRCIPALDHTTIRRLERNLGYTQDTLERVAKVLRVSVADLFLPPELADWPRLAPAVRSRIAETIRDAAVASRYRKASND